MGYACQFLMCKESKVHSSVLNHRNNPHIHKCEGKWMVHEHNMWLKVVRSVQNEKEF
jgi:Zn-finger protein